MCGTGCFQTLLHSALWQYNVDSCIICVKDGENYNTPQKILDFTGFFFLFPTGTKFNQLLKVGGLRLRQGVAWARRGWGGELCGACTRSGQPPLLVLDTALPLLCKGHGPRG